MSRNWNRSAVEGVGINSGSVLGLRWTRNGSLCDYHIQRLSWIEGNNKKSEKGGEQPLNYVTSEVGWRVPVTQKILKISNK